MTTADAAQFNRTSERSESYGTIALAVVLVCVTLAHFGHLRIPYFWDETYFARAAHDFFLTGKLIPTSVPPESHPPLVYMWIAAWWKVFGFSILVARVSMLAVALLTLAAVYQLARFFSNVAVAAVVTALTAIYPAFFTESTLVQLDMAAAGLTLWGLIAYLRGRLWLSGVVFALAVLAKETAIAAPLIVVGLELIFSFREHRFKVGETIRATWKVIAPLLLPALALVFWFGWLYHATGSALGDPQYVKYNVNGARSPVHIALSGAQHLWHLLVYLNLWVLTGIAAILCIWRRRRSPEGSSFTENWRAWLTLALLTVGYVAMLSIVGGVMLARYLLPVYPLVILACVAAIRSRVKWWPAIAILVAVAFVVALFPNTNRFLFRRDDNLAYLDFVTLQQEAAKHFANVPNARVVSVWPGSGELSETWLGYTAQPLTIKEINSFGPEDLALAKESQPQFILMFPRGVCKAESPRSLLHLWHGDSATSNSAASKEEVSVDQVAAEMNARVIYSDHRNCDWVAVLEVGDTKPDVAK
jgi:4-amino-4-deoxy-L-arabinose transferase-like glycosyltransferase